MKLGDFVDKERILLEIKGKEKDEVIEELASLFERTGVVKDKKRFVEKIKEREAIESTAIGDGIAIPHAKCEEVERLSIAIERSKEGIDFNSLDGKPVYLIFMIAAPKEAKKEYLQVIAKIARLLHTKNCRKKLLSASTVDDVLQVIDEFDRRVPKEVRVKTKDGRVIYKEE